VTLVAEDNPERVLDAALLPLHKAAFGIALGGAAALTVFLLTAAHLLIDPSPGLPLYLLSAYFNGYTVSWTGALVGAAWAWLAGFVLGWFFAFCRNFLLAVRLFFIRAKADFVQSRDFLDHI